jgi:hypothetical protein
LGDLGSLLKMAEVARILGDFFQGKSYVLILRETGWAPCWAIFFHKLIWSPLSSFRVAEAAGVDFTNLHCVCNL